MSRAGQAETASPQAWAQAVREHQECIAEWDQRALNDPDAMQTFHGAEVHLPKEDS